MVQARVANPAACFTLHMCRYLEATRGPDTRCKPSSMFRPTQVQVFISYWWSRHVLQTQQHVSPYTCAGIYKLLVVQARVANTAARFTLHTCRHIEASRGLATHCKPSITFHPTHVHLLSRHSWSRHVLQTQQHVSPYIRAGI